MQKLIFFIDDSGCLSTKNGDQYFVYAGAFFLSENEKNIASRKVYEIKKTFGFIEKELKFSKIKERKIKLKIVKLVGKVLKTCSVVEHIEELNKVNLEDIENVGKHKDYLVKRLCKKVIESLIEQGDLVPSESLDIELFIDQQLTRTNGRYDLQNSIIEELTNGMFSSTEYGRVLHPPIWTGGLKISKLKYCKSHNHHLIQAADIIAGYVRLSTIEKMKFNKLDENHIHIKLP